MLAFTDDDVANSAAFLGLKCLLRAQVHAAATGGAPVRLLRLYEDAGQTVRVAADGTRMPAGTGFNSG